MKFLETTATCSLYVSTKFVERERFIERPRKIKRGRERGDREIEKAAGVLRPSETLKRCANGEANIHRFVWEPKPRTHSGGPYAPVQLHPYPTCA